MTAAVAAGSYWRWRWTARGGAIPILLLPRGAAAGRILTYAVVLPVLGYVAATQLLPWTGRQYGIWQSYPLVVLQITTLLVWVLGGLWLQIDSWTRQRCLELGIPAPPACPRRRRSIVVVGAILTGLALVPYHPQALADWQLTAMVGSTVAVAAVIIGILVGALGGSSRYGLFWGTRARSLVPYLAVTMLLISLAMTPPLAWRERRLVSSDPLFTAALRQGGANMAELRTTEQLRSKFAEAMASWSRF